MYLNGCVQFADRGRRILGLDEHDESRLRVAPYEVAEELVERLGDPLGAVPDLALGNEGIAIAVADDPADRSRQPVDHWS